MAAIFERVIDQEIVKEFRRINSRLELPLRKVD